MGRLQTKQYAAWRRRREQYLRESGRHVDLIREGYASADDTTNWTVVIGGRGRGPLQRELGTRLFLVKPSLDLRGTVQRKQRTGKVRRLCRGAAIGEERVKTILQIIEEAGGLPKAECISIDNELWMRLVIEVLPERGTDGHIVVSVAHYGEQNSDPMRDPEMLFEVVEEGGGQSGFWPFYFRNDYAAVEQWSRRRDGAGNLHCLPRLTRDLEQFAEMWDRNLRGRVSWKRFGDRSAARPSCSRTRERGVEIHD